MPWRAKSHWGPFVWGLIHTITIIDSDEPHIQRNSVTQALEQLRAIQGIIPCKRCADHYRNHLDQLSEEEMIQPMRLFECMVAFHNQVNRKLNKPELTVEQAMEQWGKRI